MENYNETILVKRILQMNEELSERIKHLEEENKKLREENNKTLRENHLETIRCYNENLKFRKIYSGIEEVLEENDCKIIGGLYED